MYYGINMIDIIKRKNIKIPFLCVIYSRVCVLVQRVKGNVT